jgi:hypothetical protein
VCNSERTPHGDIVPLFPIMHPHVSLESMYTVQNAGELKKLDTVPMGMSHSCENHVTLEFPSCNVRRQFNYSIYAI